MNRVRILLSIFLILSFVSIASVWAADVCINKAQALHDALEDAETNHHRNFGGISGGIYMYMDSNTNNCYNNIIQGYENLFAMSLSLTLRNCHVLTNTEFASI